MEVVQEPTKKPTYREAAKWLDIWGRVERERKETGDASALPTFAGLAAPGGDSSPSDPSGCLLTHAAVETWLKREIWPMGRPLMFFVHVISTEETSVSVIYEFADGSKSDPMGMDAPPPVSYLSADVRTRTTRRCDWQKFPDEQTRQWCRLWGYGAGEFGEWQHRRLLREFARAKGVDGFSR